MEYLCLEKDFLEISMKLIPKYIVTTVFTSIMLVLLILMGLELLISFIGQLPKIGHGNYGLLQAIFYVLLDMPFELYNFFPMASLIGSLLGLGVLASQSELIVIQAAGFSKWQITATVLRVALIIVVISVVLGEIIAPYTEGYANSIQAMSLSDSQSLQTGQGAWIRQQNNFIHIDKVVNNKHLKKIISYKFNNDHQLVNILSANFATFTHGQWILHHVLDTQILSNKVISQAIPVQSWSININPTLLKNDDNGPDNMSLFGLNDYINYLKSNGLQAALYQINFWKRIFQPLATAVMIFLAIPFVFGSLRSVTVGVRILTGVTMGFLFYILNQFFAPISLLYQVPPLLGASLPTILFAFIAVLTMIMKKS